MLRCLPYLGMLEEIGSYFKNCHYVCWQNKQDFSGTKDSEFNSEMDYFSFFAEIFVRYSKVSLLSTTQDIQNDSMSSRRSRFLSSSSIYKIFLFVIVLENWRRAQTYFPFNIPIEFSLLFPFFCWFFERNRFTFLYFYNNFFCCCAEWFRDFLCYRQNGFYWRSQWENGKITPLKFWRF